MQGGDDGRGSHKLKPGKHVIAAGGSADATLTRVQNSPVGTGSFVGRVSDDFSPSRRTSGQCVAQNQTAQVPNCLCFIESSFRSIPPPASTMRVLAQGRDLAPRVPGANCRCPSPRSGTGFKYFLTFHVSKDMGCLSREGGFRAWASPKRSLGLGRVTLSTSVAGKQKDAPQDSSILSRVCHSDRRITLLPFEGQT